MVGGAPSPRYADAVGADGYAADASQTVKRAKSLLNEKRAKVPRECAAPGDRPPIRHPGGRDRARPRFCLIGERINPTGRRVFQEQLRAGDLSAIQRDVEAQVAGGADVLDVNMGVPLTDEADLLARAITMIQQLTDKPICIDSSVVDALEAGLSVYQGRALVNLITAEDERMAQILLLVKKYDAAVIALPNDEDEIDGVEKRVDLTRKIVEVATTEYGIAAADIVIDPLAMPIGADQTVVVTVLETMQRIRDEFGVNMTCGASNVSFGMPSRLPSARRSFPWPCRPVSRPPSWTPAPRRSSRRSRRPTCCSATTNGAAPGSRPPREAAASV